MAIRSLKSGEYERGVVTRNDSSPRSSPTKGNFLQVAQLLITDVPRSVRANLNTSFLHPFRRIQTGLTPSPKQRALFLSPKGAGGQAGVGGAEPRPRLLREAQMGEGWRAREKRPIRAGGRARAGPAGERLNRWE